MSSSFNTKEISGKMDKTILSLKKDIGTLRTGRANPAMFDLIRVDVYGQKMPINQLATITVPEPRTITIQVWDKSNVNLVDSEIKKVETLAIIILVAIVMERGMSILGVSLPDKM